MIEYLRQFIGGALLMVFVYQFCSDSTKADDCSLSTQGLEVSRWDQNQGCNEIACLDSVEFLTFKNVDPIQQNCIWKSFGNNHILKTVSFEEYQESLGISSGICDANSYTRLGFYKIEKVYCPPCSIHKQNLEELVFIKTLGLEALSSDSINNSIRNLELIECALDSLPHWLGLLHALEKLNVKGNNLSYLPSYLGT